ncbi:hypothetical protein JCM5353_008512 [Sporobolomyces roseus]
MRFIPSLVVVVATLVTFTIAQDTGCDMTPGSRLRECLGSYASIPPMPTPTGTSNSSTLSYTEEMQQLCEMYREIADCWADGLYCSEWLPVRTAADKVCYLASQLSGNSTIPLNSSSSASASLETSIATITSQIQIGSSLSILPIPTNTTTSILPTITSIPSTTLNETVSGAVTASATIESVIAEASRVITSIWNNDSGTDLPVISNDLYTPTSTQPTWTAPSSRIATARGATESVATDRTSSANGMRVGVRTILLAMMGVYVSYFF